jgi:hypothetical protein
MQFLTIFLIFLLLLTGLLGGGFGIREFKLPKATAGVRITAILAGLILWRVSGSAFQQPSGSVFQQPRRANFSLTNNLTQGALRERIFLTIEGEEVGSIASSSDNPNSVKEFTVPETGTHRYSVEVFGFYDNNGQEASFYGQGSGIIDVESGDVFEVQVQKDSNNNRLTFTLVEK